MPAGGVRVWVPLIGPVVAWTTHVIVVGSLTRLSCNRHPYVWVQHGATAVTSAFVVVCMLLAVQLVRRAHDDEAAGTEAGRTLFLGKLALPIGAINLALILLEGSYVAVIGPCVR